MAKQELMGYTVLDTGYQNGKFMQVLGENPGTSGNLNLIDNPATTGVAIESTESDPVIFSYAWNTSAIRVLLGKITTVAGTVPSSRCLYSLLESPISGSSVGTWTAKPNATNVQLKYNGVLGATNPHGVAQVGSFLYIVDYDTKKIWLLGTDELVDEGEGVCNLDNAPFDLGGGTTANLPDGAKGQAVIALANGSQNYLYVLYLDGDNDGTTQRPGILVKLEVAANGSLSFVAKVQVGRNPQEIIPVTNSDGQVNLLVPAIGGSQGATTNGSASNIVIVPAFATSFARTIRITGDTASYDIRVIGASAKGNDDSAVFILSANFTSDWLGVNWKLYKTTVSQILSVGNLTLTAAVGNGILSVQDQGTTAFSDYSGVYFLDLLYENAAVSNGKERLWFFQGSPLLVTLADAYGSPTKQGNAYKFYDVGTASGQIGNNNVNSADLFAETIRQAAAGASLKRGVRALKVPAVTAREVVVEEEEKK